MNHRIAGVLGLLIFLALQVGQVRAYIISAVTLLLGRVIDTSYWDLFLITTSLYVLVISLSFLSYYKLQERPLKTGRSGLSPRSVVIAGASIVLVSFGITGALSGFSESPDSWAYFELAKSFFGTEFYRLNTYRSYFSETYSASFPLGYPFLLAVGQLVFGEQPMLGIWLNAVIAALTWIIIILLARQLKLSTIAGLVLASSLSLWVFYLDEVYSGTSMAAAMLLFLLGCSLYLSSRLFFSGLFLGFSALMRFDYLVFGLLFLIPGLWFGRNNHGKKSLLLIAGFAAGISPWVIYSLTHFGEVWVSDNSWVALSAVPAYVVDFPASSQVTAFDHPSMWLARILGNVRPLLRSIMFSAMRFPPLIMLWLLIIFYYRDLGKYVRLRLIALLILLCVSVIPYLLTGYVDSRYFALQFVVASAMFARSIESIPQDRNRSNIYQVFLVGSLALSLAFACQYLATRSWGAIKNSDEPDIVSVQIETLSRCHAETPNVKYIFMGEALRIAPRYGAITGRMTAFIPSNFQRMTSDEKESYFEHMKPFVVINSLQEYWKCPPQ